ncbi:Protease HtpX [Anatilimnocola aggregata]|uniref:Protease HtpX n=1 Tax=Anatilimnocola aggregata TaxID=2528021 RepID=A0A517Y5V4_9BACT|nr:M48 family metalloprotease [Anatilimnocola aggregata]QDU25618.1 Protease HtpX [Anatilimnocola aggregata]
MQLIILAALLATLAQTESTPAPVTGTGVSAISDQWRLLLILLATLAAPVATACDCYWFISRLTKASPLQTADWQQVGHRYQRLQLAGLWLWLAGSLAVIYLLNWPAIVRLAWGWQAWPLVDDLLVLAPVIGSLLLVWTTFFYVERTAQRLRHAPLRASSLLTYLVWQSRHYLAMALVPALLIIAVHDLATTYFVTSMWGTFLPQESAWLLAIPLLLIISLGLPLLLSRLWATSDLPVGELRTNLESISHELKTPLTRLLVWHTQGRMANAAVAGLSRYCRYLFLTDALLVQLTPDEIAAVCRHELGHLQRKHLLQRLLLLVIPALAWFAIQSFFAIDVDLLSTYSPYSLAVSAGYLAYAAIVIGLVSKWLEYDADLSAVYDSQGNLNADSARDLIHALVVLQGPHRDSRFTHWLHPPTADRVAWIRRVLMQPALGFAYRRRLDQLARGIYALVVGLVLLAVLAIAA